jgi:hypothetical protein
MILQNIKTFILLVVMAGFFASCEKDNEPQPPVINFKVGDSYTKHGDTVAVGHALFFGIQARSSESKITNLTVKKLLENGTIKTVMDTATFDSYLDIDKKYYQNVEDRVTWLFSVMDRNRKTSEISLDVYKDPNSSFGGIHYFPSLKLGYQSNDKSGHFLSPSDGKTYRTDSAYLFAGIIDILCYYKIDDTPPGPALSSPGEMDNFSTDAQTFYPTIVTWENRNYTLWDISVDDDPVSTEDFNNAQNDSLLIVAYDPVWGRKKFKWATTGKVIPFQTASGKLGLIKVLNHDESEDGEIEISLKIQQ